MRRVSTFILALLAGGGVLTIQHAAAQYVSGSARRGATGITEEYRVRLLTPAHGLPSNEVFAIEEDSLGFLWLGTGNGVVRYDGYSFETFLPRPGDTTSIGGRQIFAVHVDAQGHVWAGGGAADPKGVSRFDHATQQFTRYRHDPGNPNSLLSDEVTAIASSAAEPSIIWIGSNNWRRDDIGGLSRLDVGTGTVTHYTIEDGLADNNVIDVLIDRAGILWVASSRGFNRYNAATDTFEAFFLPDAYRVPYLGTLFEDRAGTIWVGSDGAGLFRFHKESGSFTSYLLEPGNPSDPRNVVSGALEDRAGTLWVSTQGGLYMFDRKNERFTRLPDQPPDFPAGGLYEDRFGTLWVGSKLAKRGLMKVDRRANPFTIYRHDPDEPNSLAADHVSGILEDREGVLWVGTEAYLNRVDRKSGIVSRYRFGEWGGDRLYEDGSGTLWVGGGCGRDKLARMDPSHAGKLTHFSHDPYNPDGLGTGCVNHLLEDKAGNFWIAFWGGGIDRMDREAETFRHYTPTSHGLGHENVLRLYDAPSEPGSLWIGTEGGLSHFDTRTERITNYDVGRSMMMLEDRKGRFWVASGSIGLHLFDRKTGRIVDTYTTRDGLPNNVVWSVYEDDRGFLWLSTENGLSRFNPETRAFRNYYVQDGLPGNIFTEAAKFQSSSGELFFGGPDGAVSFFPEDLIVEYPVPASVVLTGLTIGGHPVEIGPGSALEVSMMVTKDLTLSHGQKNLTFEYVGLNLIDASQIRYRYRMVGYDEEWVETGTQRSARYTNLDPGDYVFQVTARNSDGLWNGVGASVRVTILPPWWRTGWAYALYGLFLVAGIFAVDRIQRRRLLRKERERAMVRELEQAQEIEAMNRQLRAHERQLETQNAHLEHQKQRLLELDALKSRFFANISHEFRTPLTLILGPVQDALHGRREIGYKQLDLIRRNAQRLLRLINQLLDLSRLDAGGMVLQKRSGDLANLCRRLTLSFSLRAESEGIALSFTTEPERIESAFDQDKIEKVVLNLLSNAFKFTPSGGKIRVQVSVQDEVAQITVKDTGQGILESELSRIFDRFYQVDASRTRRQEGTGIGLALTKELVELHDGTIEVESEPGFGTAFIVSLPLVDVSGLADEQAELESAEEGETDIENGGWLQHEGSRVDDPDPVPHPQPAGRPHILLVEDNADVRAYVRSHLEELYDITEARDGVEGLDKARALKPDLIIADVMMPRMDGFTLTNELRSDDAVNDIPIVLLTAKADVENLIEGFEEGADDYLSKPFDAAELLARVESLIEIRKILRRRYSGEVMVGPSGITVPSEDAAFLEHVREAVEREMGNTNFGVDQLADEVALSARQLQRKLKDLTNLSAGGYIRMMRLERAAQLLEQRAGPVSEVAYGVGYKDVDHFSAMFKQVYGVAPSAFACSGI